MRVQNLLSLIAFEACTLEIGLNNQTVEVLRTRRIRMDSHRLTGRASEKRIQLASRIVPQKSLYPSCQETASIWSQPSRWQMFFCEIDLTAAACWLTDPHFA